MSVDQAMIDRHVRRKEASKFKGKTILSAQEVEDIVAYITTLK